MGTKRVGWARIKALINDQTTVSTGNRRNYVTYASGSGPTHAGDPGGTASTAEATTMQTDTVLIIGKNSVSSGKPAVADPFTESATQLWPLGSKLEYGDRTFRYCQTGAAITAGKLVQQTTHVANHTNCTITNADTDSATFDHAAGSTSISIETAGDTDLTANLYAEGYLFINDQEGEGQMLRVKSHPAHDHSADPTVIITTYDPIKTAVVKNSSQASLVKNPYTAVVTAPTTESGAVVGASVIDLQNGYFGWLQTNGPVPLLTSEAVVVLGHRVVRSDADAGGVMAANSDPLLYPVGQCMASGVVDTEYALIWLNI